MPLQNRVLPNMEIIADHWRGSMMGNRGGRIHDPETKTLLKRKWASKRWIICVTEFKNRQRTIMGNSYTELFFLDEVSALTAGHRPCYECRRDAAKEFQSTWLKTNKAPKGSIADAIDRKLHEERIMDKTLICEAKIEALPDGAMLQAEDKLYAKKNALFLKWTGKGYQPADLPKVEMHLLTPPSILEVLQNGYKPQWHESAL